MRSRRSLFTRPIHGAGNLQMASNPLQMNVSMTTLLNPNLPATDKELFTRFRWLLVTLIAMFSIAAYAQNTAASGLNSLEEFIKSTKSGRASFTQVASATRA